MNIATVVATFIILASGSEIYITLSGLLMDGANYSNDVLRVAFDRFVIYILWMVFPVLGLIFSIIGRKQINRNAEGGRSLNVLCLIFSCSIFLVAGFFVILYFFILHSRYFF